MSRRTLPVVATLAIVVASASALGAQSASRARPLADLPITEVPADSGDLLAIFWSGDGGWAALAADVSRELAARGVAVVGVNSRAWLQQATRTPDDAARDTERMLRTYLSRWSRSRVVLIGYSRGAGFLPFIVNRLPADLRERVDLVALMGSERTASFEFHLMDLVRTTARPTDLQMLPELERTTGVRLFCLYGRTEEDTVCPALASRAKVVMREGDHHFDRNYPAIAADILGALPAH